MRKGYHFYRKFFVIGLMCATSLCDKAVAHESSKNALSADWFQTFSRGDSDARHKIRYRDAKLVLQHQLYATETSFCGLNVGVRDIYFGYRHVHSKDHTYGTVALEAGFMTDDKWMWKGLVGMDVSLNPVWNVADDSRYTLGFEGMYALAKQWNVILGLGADTGMRATCVTPIVGAQYTYKDWMFHIVYPDPRIVYNGFKNWTLALNFPTMFTAVRAHHVDHHKKGVALFRGSCAEFRVDYVWTKWLNIWASVGSTISARVTTGNKNFHHQHHHSVDGQKYAQIGLSWRL